MSKGIVSGVREDKEMILYQITAPISPRSSGGPVLNDNGRVIGAATFYVEDAQNLNFAVLSQYIAVLLSGSNAISLRSYLSGTENDAVQQGKNQPAEPNAVRRGTSLISVRSGVQVFRGPLTQYHDPAWR